MNLKKEGAQMVLLSIIKITRVAANKQMNFTDVCKLAQVSYRTVKHIKDGLAVRTKTAGRLAAALGVDVADIMAEWRLNE